MQRPLKIASKDFDLTEPVEAEIRRRAEALDNYYERLSGCEVTIEAPAIKHHRKGGPFNVRIRLTVPGKELAVDRQDAEEISQAIREAFDASRRVLEDYVRELRGAVKLHESAPIGTVLSLEPELDHGFIEAPDGREIYFHRHSVLNEAFDELQVGSRVRFAEEEGEKGPQASTVVLVKK